jgi:IPT/TIG domain
VRSIWRYCRCVFALTPALASHAALAQTYRPLVAPAQINHPPVTQAQLAVAQQNRAKMLAMANVVAQVARDTALAYEARFQVRQVEDEIRYLSLALQHPSCVSAGCKAALQNRIQIAQGERTTLLTIRQPRNLFGLNGTLIPGVMGGVRSGPTPQAPRGRGAPSGSCTAPQITSTYVPAGQPGTPVTINGSGFGSSQGGSTITFIVSPTQTLSGTADYWSDSEIVTSVPPASGLTAYAGDLFVTSCQQSNAVQFRFNPSTTIQMLPYTGFGTTSLVAMTCALDTCQDYPYPQWGGHQMVAGIYSGGNGNDTWFYGQQLVNGWTVSSSLLINAYSISSGDYSTFAAQPVVGSASPYTVVKWNVSPAGGDVFYTVEVFVIGPAGVAYQ